MNMKLIITHNLKYSGIKQVADFLASTYSDKSIAHLSKIMHFVMSNHSLVSITILHILPVTINISDVSFEVDTGIKKLLILSTIMYATIPPVYFFHGLSYLRSSSIYLFISGL